MKKFLKPIFCFAIMLTLCFCSIGLTGCVNNETNKLTAQDALRILNSATNNFLYEEGTNICLTRTGSFETEPGVTETINEVYQQIEDDTLGTITYCTRTTTTKTSTSTESKTIENIGFIYNTKSCFASFEDSILTLADYGLTLPPLQMITYYNTNLNEHITERNIEKIEVKNNNYFITVNVTNTADYINGETLFGYKMVFEINKALQMISTSGEYAGVELGGSITEITYATQSSTFTYNNVVNTTLRDKIIAYTNNAIADINSN